MRTKPEILLVDDNGADVKLALHALEVHVEREKIAVARDGQEALDLVLSDGKENSVAIGTLKLILLDLKLPKVDGFEVLRELKGRDKTRYIPIVILSSSNQERDLRDSYDLGANSYLQKPVDFDHYQKLVEALAEYWLTANSAYRPVPVESTSAAIPEV